MVFVGMDHGTSGISFTILNDDDEASTFKISREDSKTGRVSAIEELAKRVSLDDIDLMAINYAMGDGICEITPIEDVVDRGILSINGAGKVTGGGTRVYDEIEASHIPAVLIPGLHKDVPSLDSRFRAAYSHMASAEKVAIAYNAYLEYGYDNMIIGDISSNSVSILLENKKITGAIDACIGAMGMVHGPLDLEMLRDIDEGRKTANECFSHAGAVKIAQVDDKVAYMKDRVIENYLNGDEKAKIALESVAMTIAMEIYGLEKISGKTEAIILTGSLGSMTKPINFYQKLVDYLDENIPIHRLTPESGAIGSAQIARDIHHGAGEILGIKVKK